MARNYILPDGLLGFSHLKDSERHRQITIKTIRQALLFWPFKLGLPLITRSVQPCSRVAVAMSAAANEVPPSAMARPQGWTCCGCMHADPLGSQTLVLGSGRGAGRVVHHSHPFPLLPNCGCRYISHPRLPSCRSHPALPARPLLTLPPPYPCFTCCGKKATRIARSPGAGRVWWSYTLASVGSLAT